MSMTKEQRLRAVDIACDVALANDDQLIMCGFTHAELASMWFGHGIAHATHGGGMSMDDAVAMFHKLVIEISARSMKESS